MLIGMHAERIEDFFGEGGDEEGIGEKLNGSCEVSPVEKPDAVHEDSIPLREVGYVGEGPSGASILVGGVAEDVVKDTLFVVVRRGAVDYLLVETTQVLVGSWWVELDSCTRVVRQ